MSFIFCWLWNCLCSHYLMNTGYTVDLSFLSDLYFGHIIWRLYSDRDTNSYSGQKCVTAKRGRTEIGRSLSYLGHFVLIMKMYPCFKVVTLCLLSSFYVNLITRTCVCKLPCRHRHSYLSALPWASQLGVMNAMISVHFLTAEMGFAPVSKFITSILPYA